MSLRADPFNHRLFIGYVSRVSPEGVKVHFPSSSLLSAFSISGQPIASGLVGTHVCIEGEAYGYLGKVAEVELPEKQRLALTESAFDTGEFQPLGKVELLMTFDCYDGHISKSLEDFPRIGAKVFACTPVFLSEIVSSIGNRGANEHEIIDLGVLAAEPSIPIRLPVQSLFARHCAIVGTTGSGKSYTVARMLEELSRRNAKMVLLDATGEFHPMSSLNYVETATLSKDTYFDYGRFQFGDFLALFRPSEQLQLPKLRDALQSLRLVSQLKAKEAAGELHASESNVVEAILPSGNLKKEGLRRNDFSAVVKLHPECEQPNVPFELDRLAFQLTLECVYANSFDDPSRYGAPQDRDLGNCQSLITRVLGATQTSHIRRLFGIGDERAAREDFCARFEAFQTSEKKLFLVSLADVPFEMHSREIVVNAIGRFLLEKARKHEFRNPAGRSMVIFMDEAHQFLNRRIAGDFAYGVELDSFDQIAKECRKYGLFLVLSTQMPRDIPIGTLSQAGTFIAHRLIHERDKAAIQDACATANKHSLSYLPILGEGEAFVMGVDFAMPFLVRVHEPDVKPQYHTPRIVGSVED